MHLEKDPILHPSTLMSSWPRRARSSEHGPCVLVASETPFHCIDSWSGPFSCVSPGPGWSHRCPPTPLAGSGFFLVPFLPEQSLQSWASGLEVQHHPQQQHVLGELPDLGTHGFSFKPAPSPPITPTSLGTSEALAPMRATDNHPCPTLATTLSLSLEHSPAP